MVKQELAFSTFLKILQVSNAQRRSLLARFLQPGGYNFWHPMQKLAASVCRGEMDDTAILAAVAGASNPTQSKYNARALIVLANWARANSIVLKTPPRKKLRRFGDSGLVVRLAPELAFVMDDQNYFLQVWATTRPTLTRESLSMGLHLFRSAFETDFSNHQFVIFDTVQNRFFRESDKLENSNLLLNREAETLSAIWSSLTSGDSPSGKHEEDNPIPPTPI